MKVVVFAHQLEIGGTQTNAIDLAKFVRSEFGYDIVFFAASGPMADILAANGFRLIPSPWWRGRPTVRVMRALVNALRNERPDLLHVWDWWQYMDAVLPAHLAGRTPVLVTDMLSEYYPRPFPMKRLTTFGTPAMTAWARSVGCGRAVTLVPPVDVETNSPDADAAMQFRTSFGIADADFLLVSVSRLSLHFKGESLRRTVEAVGALGHDHPVRIVLVGDGNARPSLEELGRSVNARLGREAIQFAGHLLDPRPAYAAADAVVGMGGSALRGMAYAKPIIVVGANGFARTLTPESADYFEHEGMYGVGNGDPENTGLRQSIAHLASRTSDAIELGEFSRRLVCDVFSLPTVGRQLASYYAEAATDPRGVGTVLGELARIGRFGLSEKLRSLRGRKAAWT